MTVHLHISLRISMALNHRHHLFYSMDAEHFQNTFVARGKIMNRLTESFIRKQNFLANLHQRWKHEYLTSLREYHRNCGNNVHTLKVGDVVQIYDTSPRVNWRLILITELAEGRYPLSRSATIRTSNGRVTTIHLSK